MDGIRVQELKQDTSSRMKIATDSLGKTTNRRPEVERHTLAELSDATICPRECLSPYMGEVAVQSTVSFFARAIFLYR